MNYLLMNAKFRPTIQDICLELQVNVCRFLLLLFGEIIRVYKIGPVGDPR